MLEYLKIRNLALIEDMTLEFSSGINVLTGETGAGKTFIVKALTFLLGEKLESNMVRAGAERAQVEALFVHNDEDLVIKREMVAATGRSRLYVNDSIHSQEYLKPLREQLLAYTSQHSQQQLLQPSFQEQFFELMLAESPLPSARDAILTQLRECATKRKALEEKFALLADKRALFEMQLEEINKVKPQENEEEELEALRTQARAQKSQRDNCDAALRILYGEDGQGLLDLLKNFAKVVQALEGHDHSLVPVTESIASLETDLAHLANRFRQGDFVEETNLDAVEERLFKLAQLKRKLHKSMPEILNLQDEITENLSFLDKCKLDLSHLKKEEESLSQKLLEILEQICPLRHNATKQFVSRLEHELQELGFAKEVRVIPQFVASKIWNDITDERVRLLWAPNPGQQPQPLDRIASGGELSRFLLALAALKQNQDDATLIFDEVDAGVGGLTLQKIAEKIQVLSTKRQVLLITHWPQLASQADRHFQVQKTISAGMASTQCRQLDAKGRREELARMAGGGALGEAYAQNFK